MAVPFSLRPPPKQLGDFEFNNNFALLNYRMRLIEDFKNGLPLIHADMDSMKGSIKPIGLFYLVKTVMWLPEVVRSLILEDFCNKMTFGFSNVPGPRRPFVCCGSTCRAIGFIMPVGKDICGSFSIISHSDAVKVGICMDKSVMESLDPIVELFEKNLDEILGVEWREFQHRHATK